MGTPHKHAALIKAWADGAKIQCIFPPGTPGNKDWTDTANPVWNPNVEYRVKPEPIVVKYKRYLVGYTVFTVSDSDTFDPSKYSTFVRWIDTEWQEVEV